MPAVILIPGSSDIGSAIAHIVFKNNHFVLFHESAQPQRNEAKNIFL
jgi:predicted dinucleotide-binding enzyme